MKEYDVVVVGGGADSRPGSPGGQRLVGHRTGARAHPAKEA
jgi:hypothetical protein